ncbi:uncharacterized protein LOC143501317 [Brachyhypopomus gauderio]|uniref:uncharacterized protein LOC143501317 n=1 Tax=Brachyhypopomus gauderio TaxID=698409 RepID=UPI00404241F8
MYKTVRRVLNFSGWYFMATEYLECRRCKKKVAGWSQDILDQLDPVHREMFPAILTYRLSCDKEVVSLMRGRTLGNSVTSLYKHLCVRHRQQWLTQSSEYLSVLKKFLVPGTDPSTITHQLPPMVPVPTPKWLLTVYAQDVLSRLEETKARVTSIYGAILKMDSTKKVTKKLAGAASGTAAWATNVGNEFGQVLISVLTAGEGQGLLPMCVKLMERYQRAGEDPPQLLYVDRDCCSTAGKGKAAAMFHAWDQLVVRLDVWHFMRRFAAGVTTDSHQLYGLFMGRLSFCVFEWDAEDVARLEEAKQSELGEAPRSRGHLTDATSSSRPTAKELARHCRRRTRGAQASEELIQELLEDFMDRTDTMGIRLLDREKMEDIWQTQRRHLHCIQDPPGIQLYRRVGQVTRGGVILPVYRCARGSTSLESFHLHLNRFVPGTSASALHFQAYLLEGLVRWNEDRAAAAVEGSDPARVCYSGQLQHYANQLSQQLLGHQLAEDYTRPGEYTGELIGVEYLYSQTGVVLHEDLGRDPDAPDGLCDEDLPEPEDEGFEDVGFDEYADPTCSEHSLEPLLPLHRAAVRPRSPAASSQAQSDPAEDSTSEPTEESVPGQVATQTHACTDESLGPNGVPGYHHVVNLADSLVELRHQAFVTQQRVDGIVALWDKLPESDKGGVVYPPRHRDRLVKGRFKSSHSKTSVVAGTESLKRCFLGQGSGPAQWPSVSRLVEAICLALCRLHPGGQTIAGVRVNRWAAIMRDYGVIRDVVLGSPGLMARTRIQLFELNQRTLTQWYNARKKKQEQDVLHLSVGQSSTPTVASEPLPPALSKLPERPTYAHPAYDFNIQADASGQASQRVRGHHPLASGDTTAAPASATPATPTAPATQPGPKVPRTTAWRWKKKAEAAAAAAASSTAPPAADGQPVPTKRLKHEHYLCKQCGQPKTKEFGHSRFRGVHFCATAAGKTVEQWVEEMKRGGAGQGQ